MTVRDTPVTRVTWWALYGWPLMLIWAVLGGVVRVVAIGLGGDFLCFYDASTALHRGLSPYTTHMLSTEANLNAPTITLLFWPFAWAAPHVALLVWQAVQIAGFVGAALLVGDELQLSPMTLLVVLFATAAAEVSLQAGQFTGVLALLFSLAWRAERRKQSARAGAWMGPLLYAKPFLLVFVPWWIYRREWRALAAAALVVVLVALPGYIVLGVSGYREWAAVLHAVDWLRHPLNSSIPGLLERLAGRPSHYTQPLVMTEALAVWLGRLASAVVVGLAAWRLRDAETDEAYALLVLAALLVSPLGWMYYLPLLFAPLAALAKGSRPPLALAGYLLLCVPWVVFHAGVFGTLTYESAYAWGAILLFVAVLRRPRSVANCSPFVGSRNF